MYQDLEYIIRYLRAGIRVRLQPGEPISFPIAILESSSWLKRILRPRAYVCFVYCVIPFLDLLEAVLQMNYA